MREPFGVFIPSIILMSLTTRPDLLGPCRCRKSMLHSASEYKYSIVFFQVALSHT
jgi:hypothetical protein